ncbi:STAS domain-containing protein [Planosporangium sp. 12N6]|uniref:STAS domain-containing protein n=1 Tax=Planosporangium spinosum TaxID=3402278 RepID=UPI003CF6AF71
MHVTRDTLSDVTVARIVGTIDSRYAQEVHEGLMPILLTRQPLLLDFSEVPYVSHAGLRTMLAVYRQAQAIDGKVCVVGLNDELRLVLTATGFLRFFVVADDLDGGLSALRDEPAAGRVDGSAAA